MTAKDAKTRFGAVIDGALVGRVDVTRNGKKSVSVVSTRWLDALIQGPAHGVMTDQESESEQRLADDGEAGDE